MGCCFNNGVYQPRVCIKANVRLYSKVSLIAFLRLVHLGVALSILVLRRTGRSNDGGVDHGSRLEHQTLICQHGVDRFKNSGGQIVPLQ